MNDKSEAQLMGALTITGLVLVSGGVFWIWGAAVASLALGGIFLFAAWALANH